MQAYRAYEGLQSKFRPTEHTSMVGMAMTNNVGQYSMYTSMADNIVQYTYPNDQSAWLTVTLHSTVFILEEAHLVVYDINVGFLNLASFFPVLLSNGHTQRIPVCHIQRNINE